MDRKRKQKLTKAIRRRMAERIVWFWELLYARHHDDRANVQRARSALKRRGVRVQFRNAKRRERKQ